MYLGLSYVSKVYRISTYHMQPGSNNPPRLPCNGWTDVNAPQQFVAAIIWFTPNTFGPRRGQTLLLYRALNHLRSLIAAPSFAVVWTNIHKHTFSCIIVNTAAILWSYFIAWEEKSVKCGVYYKYGNQTLRLNIAVPFKESFPRNIIDTWLVTLLRDTCCGVTSDPLQQCNLFTDTILVSFDRIFVLLQPDPDIGLHYPEDCSPPDSGRRGGPNRKGSRTFTGCFLEKIPGHPDYNCSK